MSISVGYSTSMLPKMSKLKDKEDREEAASEEKSSGAESGDGSSLQNLEKIDAAARSKFSAGSSGERDLSDQRENSEVTLGTLDIDSELIKNGTLQQGDQVETKFFDDNGRELPNLHLTPENKVKYSGDPADLEGEKISVEATVVDSEGQQQSYRFNIRFGLVPNYRYFYSTYSSQALDLVPENWSEYDRNRYISPPPLSEENPPSGLLVPKQSGS